MIVTRYLFSPRPMHIPDGFLSLPVSLFFWAIAALMILLSLRKTRGELGERQVPLMGLMAAFIFAAQMINFPVAGGTSGHLLGGALAAILLGPWAGMLVMSAVIIVQGLLIQDGGLLVMGANIVNMGIVTAVVGYGVYRIAAGRSTQARLASAAAGAWISVMSAALLTSLELWLSGTARLELVVPAMLGVHALIGLGEALITVAALSFLLRARPDLLGEQAAGQTGGHGWIAAGALIVLLTALLSPLAAADPDGLNRVAIDLGFIHQASAPAFKILPNYSLPFLNNPAIGKIAAGLLGALLVGALVVLILRRSRSESTRDSK